MNVWDRKLDNDNNIITLHQIKPEYVLPERWIKAMTSLNLYTNNRYRFRVRNNALEYLDQNDYNDNREWVQWEETTGISWWASHHSADRGEFDPSWIVP